MLDVFSDIFDMQNYVYSILEFKALTITLEQHYMKRPRQCFAASKHPEGLGIILLYGQTHSFAKFDVEVKIAEVFKLWHAKSKQGIYITFLCLMNADSLLLAFCPNISTEKNKYNWIGPKIFSKEI